MPAQAQAPEVPGHGSDEWEAGDRRYLSEASMAALNAVTPPTAEPVEEVISLPELAAA